MTDDRDHQNCLQTYKEVAKILGVSERHIRRLTKTGKLPIHRIGIRAVRISKADLDRYLRKTRGPR